MKCVCPMGGDRTCPDDCPLAVWAALSITDRKAQRKPIAERLYKQGFTMEAIATQLGVTHVTISNDLREFVRDLQTQPRVSQRGRKNEGRPKGSQARRKNTSDIAQSAAVSILDESKTYPEAEKESGLSNTVLRAAVAREEGRRDPHVDRSDLSTTAQQKFDAAIRQYKKKLDAEFEKRVQQEYQRSMNEMGLPRLKQLAAEAKKIMDARRGFMTKETFNTIRRALHPDSRGSISDTKLGHAFDEFMRLEKYLLAEKDSGTEYPALPRSAADWAEMKRKATQARQAKRSNSVIHR